MEDLHWDFLLSMELATKLGILDGDILFNVLSGKSNLFVLARTIHAHESPVSDGDGDRENEE